MKIMINITLALAAAGALAAQDIGVEQRFGVKVKAGTAGVSTKEFVAGELAGGSPVKNAPYSAQAVTQTTQTLVDGNRIARCLTIVRAVYEMLFRSGTQNT